MFAVIKELLNLNQTNESTGMLQSERDLSIRRALIKWYRQHKRELPWRKTTDPYLIWISEIILQQTRVNQGLNYFLRFVERFPDVTTLAAAQEEEVLKYWQGLGYYSRARNLHAAARQIVSDFSGQFPRQYKDVLSLKGIGEYTAAAIVSFAWGQPYPAVDGNVFRVLSRLFAIADPIDTGQGKKIFAQLAAALIDPDNAGLYNQAIMEFGALQCMPISPDCTICPLSQECLAYARGIPSSFPVKQNKAKTRDRYFYYFHIVRGTHTFLSRRGEKDIWKGLFEFPLIETEGPVDFACLQSDEKFKKLFEGINRMDISVVIEKKKHVLSHQVLYTTFFYVEVEEEGAGLQTFLKVAQTELDTYPVSRLMQFYFETQAKKKENKLFSLGDLY